MPRNPLEIQQSLNSCVVWRWDMTYLRGPVLGKWVYLSYIPHISGRIPAEFPGDRKLVGQAVTR